MADAREPTYADLAYQAAHEDTYSHPLTVDVESILPPGISRESFDSALTELTGVTDAVFTGDAIKVYGFPFVFPVAVNVRIKPCAGVGYGSLFFFFPG